MSDEPIRRLVLVGSVIVDIVLYVEALPERGGDVVASRSMTTAGGGFNVLSAAARLGARHGASHGHIEGASIAGRIPWAVRLVAGRSDDDALDVIDKRIGTGVATQESVPAAVAVASLAPADPWRACRLAARLGGDSDTIAAMAGAVVGACCGLAAFPGDAVDTVRDVNDLRLEPIVDELLGLRSSKAAHE